MSDQADSRTEGGSEEVHAPLKFLFCRCIECAVVSEEKFVDGGFGDTRAEVHPTMVEESVVHAHGREHETKKGRCTDAALLHSIGHCKCFEYCPVVSNARHQPIVKLTYHMRETFRTAEFLHDLPQPVAIHRVKGFRQIHECREEVSLHLLELLLQLSSGEDHVDFSVMSSEAPLAFGSSPCSRQAIDGGVGDVGGLIENALEMFCPSLQDLRLLS
ncbi:unnamed protein product, partial [Schistocephalus solidus]|uniref:Mis18 domain-containing protein n=1 Tax=Schistocephalus solidus TaxID=70667 RepID=A0A183TS73_SCHSO